MLTNTLDTEKLYTINKILYNIKEKMYKLYNTNKFNITPYYFIILLNTSLIN